MLDKVHYFVFTGPESSGKTTLAERFSKALNWPLVPEYSRIYLEHLKREYEIYDLNAIGASQDLLEKQVPAFPAITDTDILTVIIWSLEKYDTVFKWMLQSFKNEKSKFYFLCYPDIPWEQDPLRENPHDRKRLFERYTAFLNDYGKSYQIIDGIDSERMDQVTAVLKRKKITVGKTKS